MRVAVATSLYEAARPFLADWIAGVRAALPPGATLELVVAAHGFAAPEAALAGLSPPARLVVAPLPAAASIAAVRNAMVAAAARAPADLVVFCDADDALLPGAVAGHARALTDADFSYGDLALMAADGRDLGATFFAEGDVPDRIAAGAPAGGALADRNFVGFSNAAVRPAALAGARPAPDGIEAVDWFLFSTLLSAGAVGRRAAGAVARYRQHGGNLLGAGVGADLAAARRRVAMALAVQAALAVPERARRRATLERLLADEALLTRAMRATPATRGVWFADVAAWADHAERHAREAA